MKFHDIEMLLMIVVFGGFMEFMLFILAGAH